MLICKKGKMLRKFKIKNKPTSRGINHTQAIKVWETNVKLKDQLVDETKSC
jgi:hypothetical protein